MVACLIAPRWEVALLLKRLHYNTLLPTCQPFLQKNLKTFNHKIKARKLIRTFVGKIGGYSLRLHISAGDTFYQVSQVNNDKTYSTITF